MGEVIWQPFKYDGTLDAGVYWFAIEVPAWDCDDDGSGRLVGIPAGTRRRVLLGYLTWDQTETGIPIIDACDVCEDQGLQDDEAVTHWAVVRKPAFPEVSHG